jgi:hypothetical protein
VRAGLFQSCTKGGQPAGSVAVHRTGADAHRGGDLALRQARVIAEHDRLALPVGQAGSAARAAGCSSRPGAPCPAPGVSGSCCCANQDRLAADLVGKELVPVDRLPVCPLTSAHRACLKEETPEPGDVGGMPPGQEPAGEQPAPPGEPDGLRDVCGRELRLVSRTRERHATIRELLTAGHSLGAISRTLGLDRGTVQRFAREPDVTKLLVKATSRDSKLDPFKPWINRRRSTSSPIFTSVRPSFTHPVTSAVTGTSASHEAPCPAGRAGRTAATTCPSSSSVSCDSSPSRARPAARAAAIYRAAVFTSTPARLAAGRLPAPASHARRTSLTCVTRTSRNAIPCRLFQSEMNRKITAGWSINWQTRWSHPRGNKPQQVVPCSWQTTSSESRGRAGEHRQVG